MLASQLATLEPPTSDENAIAVDVGESPVEEAEEIIRRLHLT
jgi:gluconokinase